MGYNIYICYRLCVKNVMEILSFFLLLFMKDEGNFEIMVLVFSSVESPHVDLWVIQKMF